MNRVLMTADTVGGVWTFALELAEALAPSGVEVLVAAMGGPCTPEQLTDAAGIPNLLLAESSYKLEWMPDPWQDVEASRAWVLDLARLYRPDLVHLNSFGHGELPCGVPTVLTIHSCVISWWKAVHGEFAPAAWNRYRAEMARSLRSAGHVTAPSRAMLDAAGGARSGSVIYNGRKPPVDYGLAKEPIIFTAGRLWDAAKNVTALARAASALPWPCYLAGESECSFPGCRMLGKLSSAEISEWYARAAIYALPARYEPFGLSVLEAALSGCALVLGDIPSLREIWGDAAIFVDDSGLEGALLKLIRNPDLRERMSRRARQRAARYTPERMAAGYLAAYRTTLRGTHACAS